MLPEACGPSGLTKNGFNRKIFNFNIRGNLSIIYDAINNYFLILEFSGSNKVILLVLDGLTQSLINRVSTNNLDKLIQNGANFTLTPGMS